MMFFSLANATFSDPMAKSGVKDAVKLDSFGNLASVDILEEKLLNVEV